MISDILTAADQKKVTLLGLLDMSAAFDTVDHNIMLRRLETSFGITGAVLSWLRSFLQDRTQQVLLGESSSLISTVTSGVPQGSVLGPLLFLLYTANIPEIASKYHLNIHFYADDSQLYFYAEPNSVASLVDAVSDCIGEIDEWMSSNRLKLNADKTQFIWLGSSFNLGKVDIQSVNLGAGTVLVQSNVNDLGIIDRQHTVHDGPCTPSVSDFVLPASPDSCNSEISHACGFRGTGTCFHLQST